MKKIIGLLLLITVYTVNAKNNNATVVQDTTVVVNENVVYKVFKDSQNFNVSISTKDTDVMMSMLRLGISVYFDVKGKEKKDVYVKYPLEPVRPTLGKDQVPSQGIPSLEDENLIKQNIARLVEDDLPLEAMYHYFDSEEQFHTLLNALDTSISYEFDKVNGSLEYRLKIPKHKISTSSKEDFSDLLIGVKTNAMPGKRQEANKGSQSGGRGGRSSGGRGGGGGRGRQGGGEPGAQSQQPSIKSLDFWFKA
ncbi:hypothetical protein SCB49_11207 [unidentified eubacterium SCB49]|nr:hypothetical protein SCB49_11207 [unidentified eubacterium SCB49]